MAWKPIGVDESGNLPPRVRKALKNYFKAHEDKGELFVTKKNLKSGDFVAGIAGDSTGNAANEHADLFATAVGVADPNLRVEIPHWDDTTQALLAPTVVQPGVSDPGGVTFHDTFNRTAADLYNTTPDIGAEWGRDGSSAAGDWSVDGSRAVRTADTTGSSMLANGGVGGDMRVELSGVLSTLTPATTRQWRVYLNYVNSSNYIYAQFSVQSVGGTVNISIVKRIAGAVTTLYTSGSGVLTANTAKVPYTMLFERVGTAVKLTVNGTDYNGTLDAADVAIFDPGTMTGFSQGVAEGDYVEEIKITILTASPPRKFTFYNGSMSGSVLTYQQSRLAAMFPVELDVLFISSCHNYGTKTPAQYHADLDAFIAAFKEVQPNAGIVIMSQNPQKAPATGKVAHLNRLASLRSYAARRGYGYVPVIERFLSRADGGVSLIKSDGVHPTDTGTPNGSQLWRDATLNYFKNLTIDEGLESPDGSLFNLAVGNDGALETIEA
jgi:hypothetical protein